MADAMPRRCQAMVITQAGLGLRVTELLALRIEDVDFLHRAVRVEWQTSPERQTAHGTEDTALAADSAAARCGGRRARCVRHRLPTGRGRLVVRHGCRLLVRHEHYGSRIFATAVRRAGLPAGTTSHHLRHHYASVLLAAGESVVAVAERLGHENATLVLKTYGHLMPDSEDRTRRAIDAAWTTDGLETASAHG